MERDGERWKDAGFDSRRQQSIPEPNPVRPYSEKIGWGREAAAKREQASSLDGDPVVKPETVNTQRSWADLMAANARADVAIAAFDQLAQREGIQKMVDKPRGKKRA